MQMRSSSRYLWWLFIVTVALSCGKENNGGGTIPPPVTPPAVTTFTNPLLSSGPDPWVIKKDSFYYYTHTLGNRIGLWRTKKMSDLKNAPTFTVWLAPPTGSYSHNVWAPELHYINNKWYIYFAADDGNNPNHRMYVIENTSADPIAGTWVFKGKVADSNADKWAIDGSVFDLNGQLYFIWSGWQGDTDGRQDIYIAPMADPVTVSGNRVLLSSPSNDWEKFGGPTFVNEGPEALKNASGRLFITYSASGCWTDNYCLGLLSLKPGGNPLSSADWTKNATPVFTQNAASMAYGPGHNSFFKSLDGTEDWILYHANSSSGQGCGDVRNPRMQQFTWNADGTPNFGSPVKINTSIQKPSGE
ncbi:MAG: family 43 glycosylhydrolase [Ferruginibacter sp.]|nr:family 43 glycosylhydrolase [Ferruginibacter sp.]